MLVIPAIDLKDGRCVRLRQGDMREETVYSQDPAAVALDWQRQGAGLIHVVDLNGAVDGVPRNLTQVEAIVKAVSVPVQVGGGIRSMETIRRYMSIGVSRVVLGTAALSNRPLLDQSCREYPDRVVVGVDAKAGKVAVQGWTNVSETKAKDLLADLAGLPLAAVIYTDISRDGMLQGPNIPALRELLAGCPFPVIASGGVTSLDDLRAIKALGSGVAGAIVGKALYDGKVDLASAIDAAA